MLRPQGVCGRSLCRGQGCQIYDFRCEVRGQPSEMRFTAVAGHLTELEFEASHHKWHSCAPVELFTAPIKRFVAQVRVILPSAPSCSHPNNRLVAASPSAPPTERCRYSAGFDGAVEHILRKGHMPGWGGGN